MNLPVEVRLKADNSFMVTYDSEVDALAFLQSKELFQGDHLVQLELWTPQDDPDKTEFSKIFIWVTLPGIRDECIRMAERIVAQIGELHIVPKREEFLVKNAKPRFELRTYQKMWRSCSLKMGKRKR